MLRSENSTKKLLILKTHKIVQIMPPFQQAVLLLGSSGGGRTANPNGELRIKCGRSKN